MHIAFSASQPQEKEQSVGRITWAASAKITMTFNLRGKRQVPSGLNLLEEPSMSGIGTLPVHAW